MAKKTLKVTKETSTGENIEFQDMRNNHKFSKSNLLNRLETGTSSYNDDYCIKHDKNGKKYIASKPDGSKNNNLD